MKKRGRKRRPVRVVFVDRDLADRMFQFEVVAKIAIQKSMHSVFKLPPNTGEVSLTKIAAEHFGLNAQHARICIGRARDMLQTIIDLDRERSLTKGRSRRVA
jgi:hypothetical protein